MYYEACTTHFPVLLCTTRFEQSTSQTTLYYEACTTYFPVLLCTTRLSNQAAVAVDQQVAKDDAAKTFRQRSDTEVCTCWEYGSSLWGIGAINPQMTRHVSYIFEKTDQTITYIYVCVWYIGVCVCVMPCAFKLERIWRRNGPWVEAISGWRQWTASDLGVLEEPLTQTKRQKDQKDQKDSTRKKSDQRESSCDVDQPGSAECTMR